MPPIIISGEMAATMGTVSRITSTSARFQPDPAAGALAAGLRGGLAAEHQNQVLPDWSRKARAQGEVEAVAVGVQDDEAGHAPAPG